MFNSFSSIWNLIVNNIIVFLKYVLIFFFFFFFGVFQFSSVDQSCLTLCDPMDCSTPGFPIHHQL